jgi:hypothetical protein
VQCNAERNSGPLDTSGDEFITALGLPSNKSGRLFLGHRGNKQQENKKKRVSLSAIGVVKNGYQSLLILVRRDIWKQQNCKVLQFSRSQGVWLPSCSSCFLCPSSPATLCTYFTASLIRSGKIFGLSRNKEYISIPTHNYFS